MKSQSAPNDVKKNLVPINEDISAMADPLATQETNIKEVIMAHASITIVVVVVLVVTKAELS